MHQLIKKAISPLKAFISDSRFIGILLLACTVISLVLSNTGNAELYRNIWNAELHYGNLPITLPHSALKWINDFLMAIFFLFAGMEIKRELLVGELSSFKKAVLPFGAALGGMIVPGLIYSSFNINTGFANGWGIPTATDIAFSIGIASLFGKRVPQSLKIFLMALAIIDDLGAIVIIALFYGNQIKWMFLLIGALVYGAIWVCNYFNLRQGIVQIILSLILWYMIFNSGIEASISGVLIAFTIPVNTLPKFENAISRFVNFFILPLFALANTAIMLPPDIVNALHSSLSTGIMMGLVIGKPVGIFIFSKAMISFKIAKLPTNTNLMQLLGVGSVAGIGFTMSIFTTTLAFQNDSFRDIAKISILASLVLSMSLSWVYFLIIDKKIEKPAFKKPRSVYTPEFALG
ncbi:MAG TPA: Na+/H+ antiporter NhaA [Chitinophagaceae bacterium]|nr:Na+/H+ antiporter NhaA [Chitinophagaceae bacterium]